MSSKRGLLALLLDFVFWHLAAGRARQGTKYNKFRHLAALHLAHSAFAELLHHFDLAACSSKDLCIPQLPIFKDGWSRLDVCLSGSKDVCSAPAVV
ncbi:unnamed protein product [Jaminaea pallidilutea]